MWRMIAPSFGRAIRRDPCGSNAIKSRSGDCTFGSKMINLSSKAYCYHTEKQG